MLLKSNWSPKSGFISPRLKLNAASVLTFTFLGYGIDEGSVNHSHEIREMEISARTDSHIFFIKTS